MIFRIAADITLLVHLAFILFAGAGALLVIQRPWIAFIQVPAAVWGAFVEISGKICPLTFLENHFLMMAGQSGYKESFIEHYLISLIYPENLTEQIQYLLALAVFLFNILIYGLIIRRHIILKAGTPSKLQNNKKK
ncbi:MAG: DUF2784 domain-containing protein [Desulfobacula sp.]|jgi:hypothetical protein